MDQPDLLPGIGPGLWPPCPAAVAGVGRTGLKVTNQTAALWSLGTGKGGGGGAGHGGGTCRHTLHKPPRFFLPLDLKTVWQKILLITFLILKKYSGKPSTCLSPCLALPGAMADTAVGELSAVGLLLFKQRHGQLGAGPEPLQIAEATAVVQFLAEPGATVPQGKLLHQPWLYGSKEVEP